MVRIKNEGRNANRYALVTRKGAPKRFPLQDALVIIFRLRYMSIIYAGQYFDNIIL